MADSKVRVAIVKGGAKSLDHVQAYMPGNYQAQEFVFGFDSDKPEQTILIVGEDVAGWTLDDYVLPRLASGLIFAKEMTSE